MTAYTFPKDFKGKVVFRILCVTYVGRLKEIVGANMVVETSKGEKISFRKYIDKSSILQYILVGKYIRLSSEGDMWNMECCTPFDIFNFRRVENGITPHYK